jgi:GTPase SAR1 family protein
MDPQSLENVETMWLPEVQHHCPGVPILLVGLQKDALKDKDAVAALHKRGEKPVSSKSGEHMADKIGAADYLECSARAGKGIDEVFKVAAKLTLLPY